jgi:putative membrane protein
MRLGAFGPRLIARYYASRDLRVTIEGGEHLPRRGPALLACRHFHHLYDGAALIDALPRKPAVMIALDWAKDIWTRRVMELACAMSDWPVVLRADGIEPGASAFSREETFRYVRHGLAHGARLLRSGEVLVVFPEAYPTIDPVATRKEDERSFLPFRGGVLTLVGLAQRNGGPRVPILPVGLSYVREGERWHVTIRLDAPRYFEGRSERGALLADLATRVRALSA